MKTTSKKSAPKTSKGNVNQNVTNEKPEFHVFFDGPFSGFTLDNDEIPYWIVKLSVDLDAEAKYSYRVNNYDKASSLAEKIATDQGVDVISSAITA